MSSSRSHQEVEKKNLRVCLICIARREPSSNRDDGTATVEAEVVADLKEPGFHTRKQSIEQLKCG